MELIQNNPYRILGVKANASLSDRLQQTNLIAQYLKIGQSARLDFDITPPLNPLERTKEFIELQGGKIHSTEDKILYSLFWFVQANGIDKIALNHLTGSKDIDKALSDFKKGCRDFVVGPDSYSAILNHSTLQIIAYRQHKDLSKLKDAIAHKFSIISDSKSLGKLKDLVAADGKNTSVQEILDLAMPKLKELLKELVPSKNTDKLLLEIFKSNTVIYPSLRNEVVDALADRVDVLVDNSEVERKKALKGNYTPGMLQHIIVLGEILLDDAKGPLNEIETLLGKSDPVYMDALQKVCEEVNYCGVLPFNKFMDRLNSDDSNVERRLLIEQTNLSEILKLYDQTIETINSISIPIKATIIKNNSSIRDIQDKLKIIDEMEKAGILEDETGGSYVSTFKALVVILVIIFLIFYFANL